MYVGLVRVRKKHPKIFAHSSFVVDPFPKTMVPHQLH